MANLKSIKSKIISYKKTGTVTHAMEAVSAVKMRKAQERALSGRAYAASALAILEKLSATADVSRHPLMQARTGKTAIIVITSDKGLAGSLNSAVIKRVEQEMRERQLAIADVEILAFGRRGAEYFKSRGYTIAAEHTNVRDDVPESDLLSLTEGLAQRNDVGTVLVVYQNFLSTFEQSATMREIVPITSKAMRELVEGIRPAKGKYSPIPTADQLPGPAAYTIEPDADSVLSVLLPRLLNIAVFHALLETKASEHSARMVAMKSATDKAKDMAKGLTRTFNKVRQAAITREVSEITSGIEAMR